MAYAESTIGGSLGGQFRVWVNSIRTFDGNQAQNYEQWRCEGGINRVTSGSRVWNLNNNNTYNIQLGINGMAASGNFTYDAPSGWTGGLKSWGTGTTTANRDGAGNGFGFQSRTDVNMQNSPYLTSGWVTSNDSVQTKPRYGDITVITGTPAGALTDETTSIYVDWYKYVGSAHLWFRLDQINNSDATYHLINPADPYTWTGFQTWLRTSMVNTNSTTLYIYYGDDLDSNSSVDRWDSPNTYAITIKNDTGQANPTFVDFDYLDANSTTVTVTGSNQVLIQGKSDLEVNVDSPDKAVANKNAVMQSYTFSIGSYSQSEPWSNTLDVPKDIGIVSDVSGAQDLSVRAVDSRGNSTTVTKNVTVLPYASPGFYNNLSVKYSNDFDVDDGLTVNILDDAILGAISPMTLVGVDKNVVASPAGLRYDIAKDTGAYSGTWTNIPFTQDPGSGYLIVDPVALATSIEGRMNSLTADNTVRWHILFQVIDKLETQYFTATIDVGEPFFRIGSNGRLYYKEIEFFETFSGKSDFYYPSLQAYSLSGTGWVRGSASGFIGGWGLLHNGTGTANGNQWTMEVYMPAGVYQFVSYLLGTTAGAIVDIDINGTLIANDFDLYNAGGTTEKITTSGSVGVLDGATYTLTSTAVGRNAGNTTGYQNGLLGIKAQRIGDL